MVHPETKRLDQPGPETDTTVNASKKKVPHEVVSGNDVEASSGYAQPGKDDGQTVTKQRPGSPLSLYVPEPEFRPGDTPNFDNVPIPRAGAVRKPPVDVKAEEIHDLAYSIVRVLNKEGDAVGPWAQSLDDQALLAGLKDMLMVRAFDARMLAAQRQGKTSFYVQCLGEEAVATAFQRTLRPGDMNFPTYRQHGLLIASGYPIVDMMNQIYSNSADPMGGRQLPVLYSSKGYGFFTISGNLATQFVQAVGWAMASAIKGDTKIAAGWIGDGSTAENDFHSALVFASTYRPPVVLNIVNNQWAISTYQGIAKGRGATFAARGLGFGIPALRVDGNDFLAVHAVSAWAAERARSNLGPTLIEHVTYRAGAHSTSDDPSAYRPKGESKEWPLGDPIDRLEQHLIRKGVITKTDFVDMQDEAMEKVVSAQKEAERYGTLLTNQKSPVGEMFEGLFSEVPSHLVRQRKEAERG
ncbi:MAG: 3-methyl-2-oxobutanoate dehydrogenase (2-methylpropanoyl-transferring) subunit alpha [Pseudomonadota bacterium]